MPLLRKGELLADDPWILLAADADIPESGGDTLIIGLDRFAERAEAGHALTAGVALACNEDPMRLAPWIDELRLVSVELPAFTDGRAYSQARLLRQRLGFDGEIRATGDVRVDQILEMMRVGIDAFVFDEAPDEALVKRTLSFYEAFYQPSYALPPTG